jgi:hypothetical protein
MDNEKMPKNAEKFYCHFCDFKCSKLSNFSNHCLTLKHQKTQNDNENGKNDNKKMPKNALPKYYCECGRSYNYSSGLSRHKKDCLIEHENNYTQNNLDNIGNIGSKENEIKILTNLVMDVVKQNKELTQQNSELTNKIVDICKISQTNTITNSNFNSHNKSFNLNFFLNETCKDAMNIMDFVESIQLQLSDLERVGELGYVEGISNIIVQNLKDLDVTQRPVHCTDKKRETIYVKDENKWEKDDENKKMHKMVRKVADKNVRMLSKFKEKYPDYNKASSKYSDAYNKIIIESMGGRGDNDFEKEEKIIKKVSKEVAVDK